MQSRVRGKWTSTLKAKHEIGILPQAIQKLAQDLSTREGECVWERRNKYRDQATESGFYREERESVWASASDLFRLEEEEERVVSEARERGLVTTSIILGSPSLFGHDRGPRGRVRVRAGATVGGCHAFEGPNFLAMDPWWGNGSRWQVPK